MKKTLVALFALAGLAMGGVSNFVFTSADMTANAGGSYGGFVFTLSDNVRMDVNKALAPDITSVKLVSIEVMVRSDNTWGADDCMYIIDSSKTLMAVSEGLTSSVGGGEMATFSFLDTNTVIPTTGANAELTIGETYYAFLGTKTNFQQNWSIGHLSIGDTYATPDTNDHQIALANVGGAENVLDCGVVKRPQNNNWNLVTNSQTYAPVMKITTTPEPATATLSLLALAGLAARRRRH